MLSASRVYAGMTEGTAILAKRTGGGISKLAKKVKTARPPEAQEKALGSHWNRNTTIREFAFAKCSTGNVPFSSQFSVKVFYAPYQSVFAS